MLKINISKDVLLSFTKKIKFYMEKSIFENFNISRNNIFSVEAAKVL
jgi:hypothetical protein